jgi:hypothetical protein
VISLASFTPGTANYYLTTSAAGIDNWTPFSITSTLVGNGLPSATSGTPLAINLANADTWTVPQTMQRNNIGVTSNDALILSNTTPSVAATPEYSPRLHLTGQGWKTSGGGGSQTVDWIAQTVPVQGKTNPTSFLDFEDQENGAGYTHDLGIFSSGGATLGITGSADTAPPLGVLNVGTGFQSNGPATSGFILEGNGSVFVSSPAIFPNVGSAQSILRSNGTSFVNSAVNTGQFQPADPTGTQSTTVVMMGLGSTAHLTPNGSGIFMIIISGSIQNTSSGGGGPLNNSKLQIYYGSGTAPSNGNAPSVNPTSTPTGTQMKQQSHNNTNQMAWSMSTIVSGLSVGTSYWFDIGLEDVTDPTPTGPVNLSNISVSVVEM